MNPTYRLMRERVARRRHRNDPQPELTPEMKRMIEVDFAILQSAMDTFRAMRAYDPIKVSYDDTIHIPRIIRV